MTSKYKHVKLFLFEELIRVSVWLHESAMKTLKSLAFMIYIFKKSLESVDLLFHPAPSSISNRSSYFPNL